MEEVERLRALLASVPRGMGLPQLSALVAVACEPGLSVNDLADRIDAPQQTASRYANVLLGRYQDLASEASPTVLLEQRVSEDDPRKRALFLTAEGQRLVEAIARAGWPASLNEENTHVRG